MNGDHLANALYELKFREDKLGTILCQKKLDRVEVEKFKNAIINDYYFQMYYDDLPLWGFIGKVEGGSGSINEEGPKYFLFEHVRFDALYNGNRVIGIRAFSDPNYAVDISENVEVDVQFTYSLFWNDTSVQFENRMEKYSKASLMPINRKIHWFSLINSAVIIVLLMGLLTLLYMRDLRNDLRKFSSRDVEEEKEVGWKYIYGDVFRYPSETSLFCAILGAGTQFFILICLLFSLVFLGVISPYSHGVLGTSLVMIYNLTSVVAGYTTASFHCQFAENGWERSVLLTGFLYMVPLLVTMSILNIVAVSYGVAAALPLSTIILVLLVYTFVNIPMVALGGVIGYRYRSEFKAPCATKRFPREVPPLAWYRKTGSQMFIGGLLPFSAVALELDNIYKSLWGYKIYTLSSILLIMFIILVILVAIMAVGLTYLQLSAEDHKWWWRSVLCGGSTAIFMYGYSVYFYWRSNMSGFMQLSFFFGYNGCMCFAFFLMLGTISFRVSLIFVQYLYHSVKNE